MTKEELLRNLEYQLEDRGRSIDPEDPDCIFRKATEALREAIRLLRQMDAGNGPLTLEELREMGGEPYWHVGLQEDSLPPHWNILDPIYAMHIEDYGYGKRWLAYRRRPEATP